MGWRQDALSGQTRTRPDGTRPDANGGLDEALADGSPRGTGEIEARLRGARLMTVEVLYYLPDHPSLLQSFIWQTLDVAPSFPRLAAFLDHWRREIEAIVHSVALCSQGGLAPRRFRSLNEVLRLQ